MPEQKSSRFPIPLFLTAVIVVSAITATSYVLLNSTPDLPETTDNIDAAKNITATTDKHLNTEIVPEFINGVSKAQLLALMPKASPDDDLAPQERQPLRLWQQVEKNDTTQSPDQLRAEPVVSDSALLNKLEVGRKIEFVIPHTGESVSGEITAQQVTNRGIKLFDIKLDNSNSLTGGHIARGRKSTDIAIVTELGNYTVTINNHTGAGQVIDSRDLNIYKSDTDVVRVPTKAPPKPEPTS